MIFLGNRVWNFLAEEEERRGDEEGEVGLRRRRRRRRRGVDGGLALSPNAINIPGFFFFSFSSIHEEQDEKFPVRPGRAAAPGLLYARGRRTDKRRHHCQLSIYEPHDPEPDRAEQNHRTDSDHSGATAVHRRARTRAARGQRHQRRPEKGRRGARHRGQETTSRLEEKNKKSVISASGNKISLTFVRNWLINLV